jgi:hypothetical protein
MHRRETEIVGENPDILLFFHHKSQVVGLGFNPAIHLVEDLLKHA